ncbi:MAG: hypothetical protein A3G20_08175 [Acidobacteria bacterium RIFCSPLOWO2_12_FULL_59_11]|nr:MAG: hypothetical protein A3G20_08175 [Acidobacteria bacterium RIFCSPLOWO2_12_FULL_59_11]
MMPFLEAIESSGFAVWLRETESPFGPYPFALALHAVSLAFLVGPNVAIDLRILGVAPRLPLASMEGFFRLMWLGFWVSALSGLVLLPTQAIHFLTDSIFYIKLGAIALAVVILLVIHRELFRKSRATLDATLLSTKAKTLAVASLACWAAAIMAGRLMAYEPYIRWATLRASLIVTVMLLAVAVAARRLGRSRSLRQGV